MFLCPWDSPGKNTGAGCHALLQGIYPIQDSNPGLPHCRWILYHLSHCVCTKSLQLCLTLCDPVGSSRPGSSVHGILQARILERVAMPSSRGSSQPRHRTQVSHIADGFFRLSHQGSPYVSIITLNINGLNAPTKRHRLAGQVKRAFMHFHLPHHSA